MCNSKYLFNHVFFVYLLVFIITSWEINNIFAFILKTLLHVLWEFVGMWTFINVLKYSVLRRNKGEIDAKRNFRLQNQSPNSPMAVDQIHKLMKKHVLHK
eukprot:549668_1